MRTPEARFTRVWTIGIPVRDQERALEFYLSKLGFEKRFDEVLNGNMRWIEVAPPGSPTSVALIAEDEESRAGVNTGIRFIVTGAESIHRQFTAQGVDVDPLLRWEGVPPMFSFRDQDANILYAMELPTR
jgi:hypothetical protein